jgi:hypothetical protein
MMEANMAAFPNTRALSKKREKLEALIEAAIDCLDSLDGDPDSEPSVGFDTPEWDDGENDFDGGEDEYPYYAKALTRHQATNIRKKMKSQLAAIEQRKCA